mmetsp:Transcript_46163/g.139952  ORF Transcript_46163/g.139952 Transcript_46163/m.139952 type:complete len:270 (+) Transcript_46163:47-856(+)
MTLFFQLQKPKYHRRNATLAICPSMRRALPKGTSVPPRRRGWMPCKPFRHCRSRALQVGLEWRHNALVFVRDEARGDPILPCTSRPSNPVGVIVNAATGEVVVDNMGHVRYVKTTAGHVGRHQDHSPPPEGLEVLLPLLLRLSAVQHDASPTEGFNKPPDPVGVLLLVDEDDDLLGGSRPSDHVAQSLLLLLRRAEEHDTLLDAGVLPRILIANRHHGRVAKVPLCDSLYLGGHGGGEHGREAVARHYLPQFLQVLPLLPVRLGLVLRL